jgi:hypothetical protein
MHDYEPVNPLKVGACNTRFDSEIAAAAVGGAPAGTNGSWQCEGDPDFGHEWVCWLRYDLKAMLDCSAIALLPNWSLSKGASLEEHVAGQLNFEYWLAREDGFLWRPSVTGPTPRSNKRVVKDVPQA